MMRVEKARSGAFPIALLFLVLATLMITTAPAYAGGIGGNPYGGYLADIGNFVAGPFAKFVGAAAIICGVVILLRSQGTAEGMFVPIASTAIAAGALAFVVPRIAQLVKPIGGGGGGGSSYFPSITQGIGAAVGPVVSIAVPVFGAIILVGGIYQYSKDEAHLGLRHFGEVAIALGVLMVGAGFLSSVAAGSAI